MCTLLCLGTWSTLNLVKDSDVRACLKFSKVCGEEDSLAEDWDVIRNV